MAEKSTVLGTLPDTGLLLIGMGPGTVAGMTLEALEAAKEASHRRYEAYTALWPTSELDALEPVSYTPLTLPTKRDVSAPVGDVRAIKRKQTS